MALYKVEKYKNKISELAESPSADKLRTKFILIKRLSSDFAIDNEKAHKIDDDIYPILHYEFTGEVLSNEYNENYEDIINRFNDILNNIGGGGSSEVDETQVEEIFEKQFSLRKIKYQNLDKDLKKKFESVQVVKYEIPNRKTPKVDNSLIPDYQQIVDEIMLGHNIFLIGGAGTGKTTLAQNVSKSIGIDYVTINCSQWTAPVEIIGGQTLDGYQDGKLIEAWRNGSMLILDELPKLDPNTAGLLNDALAKSGTPESFIYNANKEKIKKHDNFCVVATGNIYPNSEDIAYGANNKQDLSLLDRFSGSIYWIEKNPTLEKAIVQELFIWEMSNNIRNIITELQYEAQMSLRFMIGAKKVFDLEKKRHKKDKELWEKGITLQKFLDHYLSTFTEEQQNTIKEKMNYESFINEYLKQLI